MNIVNVTIRTCCPEDVPIVERLYLALYGHSRPVTETQTLMERLSEFFFVAERAGQIVGFVIGARGPVDLIGRDMAREAFPDENAYLEIQEIFVLPAHRGCGVGSSLLRAVIDRGVAAGLTKSLVYSGNQNYAQTARFYEKAGYSMYQFFMKR